MAQRSLPTPPIRYVTARSLEEYEDAFRLGYQAYLQRGLITPNPLQLRMLRHHLLPTTYVLTTYQGGDAVCSLSLVLDAQYGLPMQAVFGSIIQDLRARRLSLAEVSSYCSDLRHRANDNPYIRIRLMSLAALAAAVARVDRVMIAVHPLHAPFYERVAAFRPICEARAYPLVHGQPATPMQLNVSQAASFFHRRYSRFFNAEAAEIDLSQRPSPLVFAQLRKLYGDYERIVGQHSGEIAGDLGGMAA